MGIPTEWAGSSFTWLPRTQGPKNEVLFKVLSLLRRCSAPFLLTKPSFWLEGVTRGMRNCTWAKKMRLLKQPSAVWGVSSCSASAQALPLLCRAANQHLAMTSEDKAKEEQSAVWNTVQNKLKKLQSSQKLWERLKWCCRGPHLSPSTHREELWWIFPSNGSRDKSDMNVLLFHRKWFFLLLWLPWNSPLFSVVNKQTDIFWCEQSEKANAGVSFPGISFNLNWTKL